MKIARIARGICARCGEICKSAKAAYCGSACRTVARREAYRETHPKSAVANGTIGAANELRVAADLMLNGFAVFRALSPVCMCDLIAAKGQSLLRVEVTTATRVIHGVSYCTPHDPARYDVIAIVAPNGSITYHPEVN